jgi:hypothetical protein
MTADFLSLEGRTPSRPISLDDTSANRPMLPRPSNRIRKRFACGSVAQSVEQRPFKALVPGSSPGRPNPLLGHRLIFRHQVHMTQPFRQHFHHVRSEIGRLLNEKMETALIDPGQKRRHGCNHRGGARA